MPNVIAILIHTPWWAWAICVMLVARGLPALQTRSVPVARLLILPAVFMTWGIGSLVMRSAGSPALAVTWFVCAVAGVAIGWQTTRLDGVLIDRAAGRMTLPGSVIPLIRNLSIFLVKYVLEAGAALEPAWRASLALWSIGVSGLCAGYFAAWVMRLALRYRGTAPQALAAQPQ